MLQPYSPPDLSSPAKPSIAGYPSRKLAEYGIPGVASQSFSAGESRVEKEADWKGQMMTIGNKKQHDHIVKKS